MDWVSFRMWVAIVCTVAAGLLCWRKVDGCGWFLFIAFLALCDVK